MSAVLLLSTSLRRALLSALTLMAVTTTAAAFAAEDTTQIPSSVQAQLEDVENRFQTTLENECPDRLCTFIGCDVGRFQTLDDQASSSLPGLQNTDEPVKSLQYKLKSVKCAFAVESTITDAALSSLRNRLSQKTKQTGMLLTLESRRLVPAVEIAAKTAELSKPVPVAVEPSPLMKSWLLTMPWLLGLFSLAACALALIWGARRLGLDPLITTSAAEPKPAPALDANEDVAPSAAMLLTRLEQLKAKITASPGATTDILRGWLAKNDDLSLCFFIRHFGTAPFAEVSEFNEYPLQLSELRKKYEDFKTVQTPAQVWTFLDRLERQLEGFEIQAVSRPIEEEFGFLQSLSPAEFVELARVVEKPQELRALLTFAPSASRAAYFAGLSAAQALASIGDLTSPQSLTDKESRVIAARLRGVYASRRGELKQIRTHQHKVVEDLLLALPFHERRQCLLEIKNTQPALFQGVLQNIVMDEALLLLPTETLNELFLAMTPENAAAYVRPLPFGEQLLAKLKRPLALSIQSKMRRSSGGSAEIAGHLGHLDVIEDAQETCKAREAMSQAAHQVTARARLSVRSLNEQALASL